MGLLIKHMQDIKSSIFSTSNFSKLNITDFLYPLDLEFTLENSHIYYKDLDEKGIPYRIYKTSGKQYNPTRIAAFGLAHYNRYIQDSNLESKISFLKMADWFLKIDNARYTYSFDWEDLKAPWISCMAQGEAASLLIRAYQLTNEDKYLIHALESIKPFLIDFNDGGVQSLIDNTHIFLEEYPSEKNPHVLNGFLYALIGLIEVLFVFEDKELLDFRNILLGSLNENIDKWGPGTWSFYQIDSDKKIKNYCTPSYHNLHITQLKFINHYFPSEKITKVINRWTKGRDSRLIRVNALFFKVAYRLNNKAQR